MSANSCGLRSVFRYRNLGSLKEIPGAQDIVACCRGPYCVYSLTKPSRVSGGEACVRAVLREDFLNGSRPACQSSDLGRRSATELWNRAMTGGGANESDLESTVSPIDAADRTHVNFSELRDRTA